MIKKTISFDFDSTLTTNCWDFDSQFWNGNVDVPNEPIIERFKTLQSEGHKVGIVTSRVDFLDSIEEVIMFTGKAGIKPNFLIFTNGEDKAPTLKTLGCDLHFDDDLDEAEANDKLGIKTIVVLTQPDEDDVRVSQFETIEKTFKIIRK